MTKSNKFKVYTPLRVQEIINTKKLKEKVKSKPDESESSSINISKFKQQIGEPHPFKYKLIDDIEKKFPLTTAVIDRILDKVFGGGIYISSQNENLKDKLEDWIDKNYFCNYAREWLGHGLRKGISIMEVAGLSNEMEEENIAVAIPNDIYIKKNYDTNEIEDYVQYLGEEDSSQINENKINKLGKDDIVPLTINKIGRGEYGYGIIYPSLPIIENLLMSQKTAHTLAERKANSPLHVKMGNVEKEDYPEQEDIDDFGEKLTYMNDTTEYVTGPNIEMNVVDFGNIGEKIDSLIDNDFKFFSYAMQVPEVVLGHERGYSGSSNVQGDEWNDTIQAYKEKIRLALKKYLFNKLARKMGYENEEYDILIGFNNEKEKSAKRESITQILGSKIVLSEGMRKEYERKLAELDGIDYEFVEKENDKIMRRQNRDKKKDFNNQLALQQVKKKSKEMGEVVNRLMLQGLAPQEIENECIEKFNISEEEAYNLVNNFIEDFETDYELKYWVGEFIHIKDDILETIENDLFKDLIAYESGERALGKLPKNKLPEVRKIFKDAFEKDQSLHTISRKLKKLGLKDRFKLVDGKKVKTVSAEKRPYMISRTETVRLRAEGSLDAFSKKGKTQVVYETVSAHPCPICQPFEGAVFGINEVRGMLPQHVNCFIDYNTRIYTSKGYKNINKIQVGDKVLTHNGKFKNVKKLSDDTIRYTGDVIELQFNNKKSKNHKKGQFRKIRVTPDHPILTKKGWKNAKDITYKDEIVVMGNKCKECGEIYPLLGNYDKEKGFCSLSCSSKFTANKQFKDKEQHTIRSKKAIQQMKRENRKQTWSIEKLKQLTKNANIAVRKNGFPQRKGIPTWSKGLTKLNHPSLKKISDDRKGKNNPMHKTKHDDEYWNKLGKKRKEFWRNNPEKHPNRIMCKKGFISKPQKMIYEKIKKQYINAKLEYPIKTTNSVRFADIALPEFKIDIEYDGEYWHKNKLKDEKRDEELKQQGWTVLRFNKNNMNNVVDELNRILNNHKNNYLFTHLVPTKINKIKVKNKKLYNFSVDEDESYIANNIVVHNCRCRWSDKI